MKGDSGVSSVPADQTGIAGSTLSSTCTAKTGYHLTKYTGTIYDGSSSDGVWTDCSGKSSDTTEWLMNADRTITVYSEPNQYTLTLDHNGGIYNDDTTNSYTVTYDAESCSDISWNLPTRTGYTFDGYWTTSTGGTQVYGADGICINDNIHWKNNLWCKDGDATIYAHWKINSYSLTVDPNKGTWSDSTKAQTFTITYGSTKTIESPIRTGYDFSGWDISGADSTMDGTTFTMGSEDATLTAKWSACVYVVTFDMNDGYTETGK